MKKLFAAIVLAALAIGSIGAPVLAQEDISPAEHKRLFREGAKPTSEEVAERIGYNPLDVRPLVARFQAAASWST